MESEKLASEDEILDILGTFFPLQHRDVEYGRGDDCAIFSRGRGRMCVSSDLFLEDVHFRRSYFTPEEIGYKALACNLSDLAACGVRPVAFVLNLGLPSWVDAGWFTRFAGGMAGLANRFSVALAGGDLSSCETLHISITVFGREHEEFSFLKRGGALPGDAIFVVGPIGLARVGLAELEAMGRAACDVWPEACRAHLMPEPQVDAGLMLSRVARQSRPPSLMDISDGIVRDLPRLLGLSGEHGTYTRSRGVQLGAELLVPAGDLPKEVCTWCQAKGKNAVTEALLGGEDYALLGTCAPDMLPILHAAISTLWEIGTVTDSGSIYCNREPLETLHGFDHFSRAGQE